MKDFETKTLDISNGNSFCYVNYGNKGTWYKYGENIQNEGWKFFENEKLWSVLSSLVHSKRRVRIWYGDRDTGTAWNEEYEVTGTIGRSRGNISIPLLIKNTRSTGGCALLDDCIVRIDDIAQKRTLYEADNFHVEDMEIEIEPGAEYPYKVMQHKDNGEIVNIANFKNNVSALHYRDFMTGDRYCK